MNDTFPKKRTLLGVLILMLFLFFPFVGPSQEYSSITLNAGDDYTGTSLNNEIPFSGQFNPNHPHYSQFILPSYQLLDLLYNYNYNTIQSFTFYLDKSGDQNDLLSALSYDPVQMYVAEVDQDYFSPNENGNFELYDWNQMELVDEYCYAEVMEYDTYYSVKYYFPNGYLYEGGSLLIGIKPFCNALNYGYDYSLDLFWIGLYGGSSLYTQYDEWTQEEITYTDSFVPKTTIEYQPLYYSPCLRPHDLYLYNLQSDKATLYWNPVGTEYQWDVAITSDLDASLNNLDYTTVDVPYFEFTGLNYGTTYKACVRANCGTYYYSKWAIILFTTLLPPTVPPTALNVTDLETPEGNSATLNWNYEGCPLYWNIALSTDLNAEPDEVNYFTINNGSMNGTTSYSYQLTGLEPFIRYKVWVRADYGDGEMHVWSTPIEFTPISSNNLGMVKVNVCYNTSKSVPFSPRNYTYDKSKSQFIIPASDLTELEGQTICKLYFHHNSYDLGYYHHFDIYFAEVEMTEFVNAEYYDWNEMNLVAHNKHISGVYSNGTILLDSPYSYTGGNLLIGVDAYPDYADSRHAWYGCTVGNYPSLSSVGTSNPVLNHFAPQTWFYYASDSFIMTDTVATTCDELVWHGKTLTETGIYYDTLSTQNGMDSIVVLNLTVYPSYHHEYVVTSCSGYLWEDSVYFESGDYVATYQNAHECDSVLILHLTINESTPLGDFTYMSPADGYINLFSEADFYWDEVPNAESYDFYLWQGNGNRPETPMIIGGHSTSQHIGGLEHGIMYHWCVVAKNECDEEESATRSLSCQLTPSLTVFPKESLDFGEVECGKSQTKTISVSGNALSEAISYTFLDGSFGQDADYFSITSSENWNSLIGGSLKVTFTPGTDQLYYSTAVKIVSGAFVDTVYCEGSLANRFVFITDVDGEVFSTSDEIIITGHVEDVLGNAVADLDVDVYLLVMGSRITIPTVSNVMGDYMVTYTPRYSEAGF